MEKLQRVKVKPFPTKTGGITYIRYTEDVQNSLFACPRITVWHATTYIKTNEIANCTPREYIAICMRLYRGIRGNFSFKI